MKKPSNQVGNTAHETPQDENGLGFATSMESDENLVDVDSLDVRQPHMHSASQVDSNQASNG